jgi:hypothetical protein
MFQSCVEEKIDVPKEVQTMLKLCLIIKCQWIQLGSGHLNNDVVEIKWWNVLGWRNLEILNMSSNLSGRLICGSFEMLQNVANV